jgi:small subunit ribosomal protein S19
MARSIKKGPYVATHLEKKVLAINEGKSKRVLSKPGADVQPSLLIL